MPQTEAEWIDQYREFGRQGVFDAEPDYPQAIAEYQAAFDRFMASTNPPRNPPADWKPMVIHSVRVSLWRRERFPELKAASEWLHELLERRVEGLPPLTEAEREQLATWFHANDSRLREIEKTMDRQLFWFDDGTHANTASIRHSLASPFGECRSARIHGSGRAAQVIRTLMERYPN